MFAVRYGRFESWVHDGFTIPNDGGTFYSFGNLDWRTNKNEVQRYPDEDKYGETFVTVVPLE